MESPTCNEVAGILGIMSVTDFVTPVSRLVHKFVFVGDPENKGNRAVDLSWVRALAEQSNVKEEERAAEQVRQKEEERQVAISTTPFVEKLHLLIATCAEEFNKYIQYHSLRVITTRVQKRSKRTVNPENAALTYDEEIASFTFGRGEWTFGVRGVNGLVEFIELPSKLGAGGLDFRFEDAGATPSHKLTAVLDKPTQQILWMYDERIMDGEAIISLCREYFMTFIQTTNP